jgi:hypothetical protein
MDDLILILMIVGGAFVFVMQVTAKILDLLHALIVWSWQAMARGVERWLDRD